MSAKTENTAKDVRRFTAPMRGNLETAKWSMALALLAPLVVFGTGLATDDFTEIVLNTNSSGSLFPRLEDLNRGLLTDLPVGYWLFGLPYHYLGFKWLGGYELLKGVYAGGSVWMVSRFFSSYADDFRAAFISFFFVFFPNHDATAFFFLGQYLLLAVAGYCFADYLIRRGHRVAGVLSAFLASFISYGSMPVAVFLGALAALEGRYRDIKYLVGPNILYILYYLIVTQYFLLGHTRLPVEWNLISLLKQYVLQLATFVDATLGPSLWLKIVLSIVEASTISLVLAALITLGVWVLWKPSEARVHRQLVIALAAMVITALAMFAVTGRYPQLAFNLGNRVSIYGSLLLSYLVVINARSRLAATCLTAVMVLAILGLSDHWRNWSGNQTEVMKRIEENKELRSLKPSDLVLVTGNQYSRLGSMSHIEFFSEDWVVGDVFTLAINAVPSYRLAALNSRRYVDGDVLIDRKYGTRIDLAHTIVIYESETDRILRMTSRELAAYIASLPIERRHWSMFLPKEWIRRIVIPLMPRLEYALHATSND